ncbi:MAG: hypothetical protein II811_08840, partial [Spirochaetaceae bacterium]|nr:hypothetical protein [Spirochaetaceae bacterium]
TLSGNNTITTFTAETGGIALSVNGSQTISGALTLSGEEDNLLALSGSGQFVAAKANVTGEYLLIGGEITIAESSGNVEPGAFEVKESEPNGVPVSTVYNHGWKIVNKLAIIKTIAPVGSNSIYIAFNSMLYSPDGALLTTATDIRAVSSAFAVQKNGEDIYRATAAKIVENSNGESGIIITISGRITLDDVKNADLAVTETSTVFFGEGGKMLSPLTHCVSHVVAGAVEVLYAKANLSEDLPDAYTARNFSKDSGEDGKVLFSAEDGYSVTVSTHIATAADANGNLDFTLDFSDSLLMYAKKSSPKSSDTSLYENVPSIAGKTAGASYLRNFTLDFASSALSGAQAGDAVEFMFVLADSSGNVFTRSLDGNKTTTLPVLRLTDSSDPRTLDTWRFTLSDIKAQRGGVTILNNVINSLQKEQTTIVVDTPSSGTLSVYVMTLDGRIVRTLSKSRVKAGKHYFTWNGTNGAGKSVARGLYFVRVLSADIDETRKVLVIKE